jgi:hypothetical protein
VHYDALRLSRETTPIATYLYQYFIYVPILIIEVPKDGGVRKPIFMVRTASTCHCTQYIDQETTDQEAGYLRLRVRNTGLAAAEKCVFQVRAVRWSCSPDRPSYCYVPSDECLDWQDVMWSDRKWKIVIRPNDVRYVIITIIPLQYKQAYLKVSEWHCANKYGPVMA